MTTKVWRTVDEATEGLACVMRGQSFALESASETETAAFAAALGRVLPFGAVVALSGPLGAGKTALVRGLAEGLGVPSGTPITSPSYALVNAYILGDGERFYHADLYRLGDDPGELEALGFRDWLADARCVAIEWAEQSPDALDAADLAIAIEDTGAETRILHVTRGDGLRDR